MFLKMKKLTKQHYSRFNWFQNNIADGKPNDWRCRAGARYLYICEDGLVHYCSQQRGYPGIPLSRIYGCRHSPRVSHRKGLRSALHRLVRASGVVYGLLARAADAASPQPPTSLGAEQLVQIE